MILGMSLEIFTLIHVIPFSVYGGGSGDQVGSPLIAGAQYCECDTLHPAPYVEEDLRNRGMYRLIPQRFCSRCAIL
jgi:hypothetical protein